MLLGLLYLACRTAQACPPNQPPRALPRRQSSILAQVQTDKYALDPRPA